MIISRVTTHMCTISTLQNILSTGIPTVLKSKSETKLTRKRETKIQKQIFKCSQSRAPVQYEDARHYHTTQSPDQMTRMKDDSEIFRSHHDHPIALSGFVQSPDNEQHHLTKPEPPHELLHPQNGTTLTLSTENSFEEIPLR